LLASRRASKGKVLALEPNRENYDLLIENIRLNRVQNVMPIRAAVAGSKGTIKLFTATQGGYHSILKERMCDANQYEVVESISLKDVFTEHRIERINFLKLDCEGAEYDILYNLPLEYYTKIDRISMEYHGDKNEVVRRSQANALVAHLIKAGFRIDAYVEFVGFRGGHIRASRS
jgi:FkbM family methyltransferase